MNIVTKREAGSSYLRPSKVGEGREEEGWEAGRKMALFLFLQIKLCETVSERLGKWPRVTQHQDVRLTAKTMTYTPVCGHSWSNLRAQMLACKIIYGDRIWHHLRRVWTVWYWHKDWNINRWNRIESPEINIDGQFFSEKGAKRTKWGEIVFSTKDAGDKWISTCRRLKQLKMDHRPKCKTQNYKTPRRKYRSKSSWPWIRQWFLRYDTKSTRDKIKNRQIGLHQNKKFYSANDIIKKDGDGC